MSMGFFMDLLNDHLLGIIFGIIALPFILGFLMGDVVFTGLSSILLSVVIAGFLILGGFISNENEYGYKEFFVLTIIPITLAVLVGSRFHLSIIFTSVILLVLNILTFKFLGEINSKKEIIIYSSISFFVFFVIMMVFRIMEIFRTCLGLLLLQHRIYQLFSFHQERLDFVFLDYHPI